MKKGECGWGCQWSYCTHSYLVVILYTFLLSSNATKLGVDSSFSKCNKLWGSVLNIEIWACLVAIIPSRSFGLLRGDTTSFSGPFGRELKKLKFCSNLGEFPYVIPKCYFIVRLFICKMCQGLHFSR